MRAETTDDPGYDFNVPPAVADGVVYAFPAKDKLYALDAADGSERWTADLGDYASGPPTPAGDTVYFGCGDRIWALDRADGSTRWSVYIPSVSGSPAVIDDTVYIGASGTVYALNAADGSERWTATGGDGRTRVSAPTDDTLYTSGPGGIYALDGADGAERWRVESLPHQEYPTSSYINLHRGLAVAGDSVYASVEEGPLYKIGADGDVQEHFQVERGLSSSPVIADGTVYVGSKAGDIGRLHALDTTEGTERWSFPVGGFYDPVVADGTVYVTSSGSLYALKA